MQGKDVDPMITMKRDLEIGFPTKLRVFRWRRL